MEGFITSDRACGFDLSGSNISSDSYIVLEPTLLVNNYYYDSWQGYVEGCLDGNLEADKNDVVNLQVAGDGFSLSYNDYKLHIYKPSNTIASKSPRAVSDLRHTGYGIHLFDGKYLDVGKPVDSYRDRDEAGNKIIPPIDIPEGAEIGTEEKENNGESEIVKIYADVYQDKQGGYTHIEETGYFIEEQESDKVVIKDEEGETGYKVVAWSTANSKASGYPDYTANEWIEAVGKSANPSATNAGLVYSFDRSNGGKQHWNITNSDTNIGNNTAGTKQYYSYNWETETPEDDYVTLGEDKSIYILLIREHSWIESSANNDPNSHSSYGYGEIQSPGNNPPLPNTNPPEEDSGNLTIVKVYGEVNSFDFSVVDVGTTNKEQSTYNVNLTDEDGWTIASYIFSDNKHTDYTATSWLDGNIYMTDGTVQFMNGGFDYGINSEFTLPKDTPKTMWTKSYFKDTDSTNDTM